jgi:hypothetical protein
VKPADLIAHRSVLLYGLTWDVATGAFLSWYIFNSFLPPTHFRLPPSIMVAETAVKCRSCSHNIVTLQASDSAGRNRHAKESCVRVHGGNFE